MSVGRQEKAGLEQLGRRLQWATIAWNALEVAVTVALGVAAGSLALVAFGLDSLVEVFASVVVIWHLRPGDPDEGRNEVRRERRAMLLVGAAFALLCVYLLVAGARQLAVGNRPESSVVGIAYLFVTALVMFGLAAWKGRVGEALRSGPFLAEASMTFLDGCLATSILLALALNLFLGWWWADPVAALLIGAVAAREARASWRVAAGLERGQ